MLRKIQEGTVPLPRGGEAEFSIFTHESGENWVLIRGSEYPGAVVVQSERICDAVVNSIVQRELGGVDQGKIRIFYEMSAGDDLASPWSASPIHEIPIFKSGGKLNMIRRFFLKLLRKTLPRETVRTNYNRPAAASDVAMLRGAMEATGGG